MGRGKRNQSIALSIDGGRRRLPASLAAALAPDAEELAERQRQRQARRLAPYFGSFYGLNQVFEVGEGRVRDWLTNVAAGPNAEEAVQISTFLDTAALIDELSGSSLLTGDWLRSSNFLITDPFPDPDASQPGRDYLYPGQALIRAPHIRTALLDSAEDDFRHGGLRQREALLAKGYRLESDGRISGPQGTSSSDGSPYFHRPRRDSKRPTLATKL